MKNPLIFMPVLNLVNSAPSYHDHLTSMFLKSHQGRGHIIMPASPTNPAGFSYAVTQPNLDHPIHLYLTEIMPRNLKAAAVDIVVPCPRGVQDPAWNRLNRVYQRATVRRIILTRQGPEHRLDILDKAIDTLSSAIDTKIFLDWDSFGWDAIGHFLSRYPHVHIEGVPDDQLYTLMRLAEVLDRPIHLDDLRAHPKPIEPLFHHKIADPPAINVHRIPFPSQYR